MKKVDSYELPEVISFKRMKYSNLGPLLFFRKILILIPKNSQVFVQNTDTGPVIFEKEYW